MILYALSAKKYSFNHIISPNQKKKTRYVTDKIFSKFSNIFNYIMMQLEILIECNNQGIMFPARIPFHTALTQRHQQMVRGKNTASGKHNNLEIKLE